MAQIDTILNESELTWEECFLQSRKSGSLKCSEVPGFDEFHINVYVSVFDHVKIPQFYIFRNCFRQSVFPENMKTVKVTLLRKTKLSHGQGANRYLYFSVYQNC